MGRVDFDVVSFNYDGLWYLYRRFKPILATPCKVVGRLGQRQRITRLVVVLYKLKILYHDRTSVQCERYR